MNRMRKVSRGLAFLGMKNDPKRLYDYNLLGSFSYIRQGINDLIERKLLPQFRLPKVPQHIHMPVALKGHTLFFQQRPLARPPWGCAAFFIDYSMTGQVLSSRSIS